MDFLTYTNNNLKRYNEQLRFLKMVLYADFKGQYKKSFDEDTAKVLAAQLVNCLMGEDIEEVYRNASEPLKTKIGQIKNLVSKEAEEKLQTYGELREIIVYTLRMEVVHKMGELGELYLNSDEKARIDSILERYGSEFPMEVTPSLYSLIVTRFLQDRQHLLDEYKVKNNS